MARTDIAVIIPVYNHARFLERTLQSVFAQTLSPAEIIVVDDNSTDGSWELLQQWVPRITLVRKPADIPKGPAPSQNLALSMTTAPYVAFLDSDDIWMPEKLRKQVDLLEHVREAGLCYCNGIAIDDNDELLYQLLDDAHREPQTPEGILLDCYIVSPSKVLVRRALFERVGVFREGLRFAHDHDMWIRMHEVTKFLYLPEILMGYRRHPHQISQSRDMWQVGFNILRDAARRYPYRPDVYRKRWAVLRYRLAESYWKQKEAVPAMYNFVLSAVADPLRAVAEVARRAVRQIRYPDGHRA